MDQEGKVIHRLFGKWHEGLYCGVPPSAKCVWRPGGRPSLPWQIEGFYRELTPSKALAVCVVAGSMPTDYELYYGFTRFASELNELCPELKDVLPRTDTRFRPDQR